MFWSVKFLSGISIPVDFRFPPVLIHSRALLYPSFFSISRSASLLLLQIYYHPAGNITEVFIATQRRKRRSSYLPLPLSESWFFDSFPTRNPPQSRAVGSRTPFQDRFEDRESIISLLQWGLRLCGDRRGIHSTGCKDGMLKRTYFIALIMNESPLSLATTN